ncbi:hypothetical protein MXB_349 [Myxobolus squamalis]|nr:hypothetical protein MXB_349 [Myxobolus squamalis]
MVGIYILGSIMVTMGSNIIYISYTIDKMATNPEIDISMGFGMVLTIIGVIGILMMTILLSVTLTTVESAKIQDEVKTATLVNRATMMTLGRSMAGTLPAQQQANMQEYMESFNKTTTLNQTLTHSGSNELDYQPVLLPGDNPYE